MFNSRRIITSSGGQLADDYALSFDQSTEEGNMFQVIRGDSGYVIATSDTAWTCAFWIGNYSEAGAYGFILGGGTSPHVYLDNSSQMGYRDSGGNYNNLGNNSLIEDGGWHHFVLTCESTDENDGVVSLYIDGEFVDSVEPSGENRMLVHNIGMSYTNNANRQHAGNFDCSDSAFYDVGMSASQVKTLYNGGEPYDHRNGILGGSCVGWYRMGDDDAINVFEKTELIINGDMEDDSDWADYGTLKETSTRSSTQKFAGTYSRRFRSDGTNANAGIQSTAFSVVAGKTYSVQFHVYPDHGTEARLIILDGDGSQLTTHNPTWTINDWNYYTYFFTMTETGSSAKVIFHCGADNADGNTWYVDDVSVSEAIKIKDFSKENGYGYMDLDTANLIGSKS